MKKHLSIIMVLLLVVAIFAGCAQEPAVAPTEAPTAEPTPEPTPEESASFVIDFENEDVFTYQTVNFDEAITEKCYKIEPNEKLNGNAFKGIVKGQEEGATWWVAGMAFAPEYTQTKSFKDLEKITFKYTSTVDFSGEIPFVVQLVWKDVITGEQVAIVQVDFPIEKNDEMIRFEIEVPEETKEDLNGITGYYLDWFMVGLEGNADDLLNPENFMIDDVAFYGDASYIPPEIVIPEGPTPIFSIVTLRMKALLPSKL